MPEKVHISNIVLAQRVVRLHQSHADEMASILSDLRPLLKEEEFIAYRAAVGQLMGRAFVNVLEPLYEQHPELEPDSLRNSGQTD